MIGCSSDGEIEDVVRASLYDPDSVKFGEVRYFYDGQAACITVNAKNRLGGYVGDTNMALYEAKDGSWSIFGKGCIWEDVDYEVAAILLEKEK